MALNVKLASGTKDNIKVIMREDSAINESITDEDWELYVSTLDEKILKLTDEPTRFVMKITLSYEAQMAVRNAQLSYSSGKAEVRTGYMLEEIRYSLVGIENPPNATSFIFKKDDDGYASRDLIAELNNYGFVNQLFIARNNAVSRVFQPTKK